MATNKRKTPKFAEQLRKYVRSWNGTQRELSRETGIPVSSLNRLCNYGLGSEDNICIILDRLGLGRRMILKLLIDRRVELSSSIAGEVWKSFEYGFLSEEEYLAETCQFPLQRAYVHGEDAFAPGAADFYVIGAEFISVFCKTVLGAALRTGQHRFARPVGK